ncbi:bifunctional folylpolyglutamate synthase/dihydrofolate synthase [Weeksellaceae bacterium KMM 9724]|uniref:bifunctional folylpolyglutamate synthase/dihydrofolate synthase n=1 Tax=Profundicola chukchiensis TaxID=2961959 RepID=UPI00243A520C|nr:folylpolyglutamate synthase/dihydrofolate synthase family protein [Profundicola chukchiensis]MDG4949920.1 bifunctional folylpolyglutamate synthase/dihydrofolate synthase [Profundicola chukchiensis]
MKNYNEVEQWLFQKLPMFQRVGATAYKANLDNIINFCKYLGNPQDQFKTIHVAGTNGKGSTSHMMASVLQEAGYKVGLHTSPHLKHFGERSRINGQNMPDVFIIDFVNQHKEYIENSAASFFEVAVTMGFAYFAKQKVDIAVIETGLGGRLDSTNIIHPEISVITNIGIDHVSILGDNVKDIAKEKAGIIKENIPIVIGEYLPETKDIFKSTAEEKNAQIYFVQDLNLPGYESDLKGIYQRKNVKTAAQSLRVLKDLGWKITEENIIDGLKKVVENTQLRGRWDVLQQSPLIVADTAHNPDGINQVKAQIAATKYDQLHMVLGFVNDKDVNSILSQFPQDAQYYFCAPNVPRKLEIDQLKEVVSSDLNAAYYTSVQEALNAAKKSAKQDDMIYVGGSTFVVAEVV